MSLRAVLLPCGQRFALFGERWRGEYPVAQIPKLRAFYAKLASLPRRRGNYQPTVEALDALAREIGGGAR